VFHFVHPYAEPNRNGWAFALPAAQGLVTLTLVSGDRSSIPPHRAPSGTSIGAEMELPTGRPNEWLLLRIYAPARDVSQIQRYAHRELNGRRSGFAIAGMLLLLAVCGWIVDGEDGARRAVAFGGLKPDDLVISPDMMARRFGAKLLNPAEMPALFARLHDICGRARLVRAPDLYCLPAPNTMNAYALGGLRRSAIVLTDGLLHRMTEDEVAGILAHEVAHLSNNDRFAMDWATSLQRAVAVTALAGLAAARQSDWGASTALVAFLRSAPSIAQLLYLALSRSRELDADARALDLIDCPHALVAALNKLEHFHANAQLIPMQAFEDGVARLLRSHPTTCERVGLLALLAY
jgi:heat shock protein HtpX